MSLGGLEMIEVEIGADREIEIGTDIEIEVARATIKA